MRSALFFSVIVFLKCGMRVTFSPTDGFICVFFLVIFSLMDVYDLLHR